MGDMTDDDEFPTGSDEPEATPNLKFVLELISQKAELTSVEIKYIFDDLDLKTISKDEFDKCEMQKQLFFLKSSKTGGTTVMAILMRFGLHYNLRNRMTHKTDS